MNSGNREFPKMLSTKFAWYVTGFATAGFVLYNGCFCESLNLYIKRINMFAKLFRELDFCSAIYTTGLGDFHL